MTLSNVVLTDVDSFAQPNTAVNGSIAVKPFVIRLNPASTQIYIIDPKFTVDVVAECAYDLGSFQFDLDYDQTVAKADAVRDGGFISALRPISELGPNIDNTAGYLDYGQISFGSEPGTRTATASWRTSTSRPRRWTAPRRWTLLNVRATDTRSQEEIPIVYGGAVCVKDYALSSIGDRVWYDTNGNGAAGRGRARPGGREGQVDRHG